MPRHYYTVTWDQLHRDARALAWRLIGHGPFSGIVAITRGGLIPAAIVAREMEVRLVETVSWWPTAAARRTGPSSASRRWSSCRSAAGDGEGLLLIDDLVDTGATARVVRALLPKAHFATVYSKPAGGAGGHLHHRGEPGHLDHVSVGHRAAIRGAAGQAGQARGVARSNG